MRVQYPKCAYYPYWKFNPIKKWCIHLSRSLDLYLIIINVLIYTVCPPIYMSLIIFLTSSGTVWRHSYKQGNVTRPCVQDVTFTQRQKECYHLLLLYNASIIVCISIEVLSLTFLNAYFSFGWRRTRLNFQAKGNYCNTIEMKWFVSSEGTSSIFCKSMYLLSFLCICTFLPADNMHESIKLSSRE